MSERPLALARQVDSESLSFLFLMLSSIKLCCMTHVHTRPRAFFLHSPSLDISESSLITYGPCR